MKFRGAGQGPLALVAEIIAGELARRLGLRTPDLALAELDPRIPGSEPDPEIQDLLRASEGLNLGVDFLPGSVGFDPLGWTAERDFASQVLWFDALVQNDGATNANLQFALENAKAAQADARTRAIADARSKAQAMADAAGVRLGAAISVSDQSSGGTVVDSAKFIGSAPAPAAQQTQIPVSDLDIVIRVTVQFAIG